MTTVSGRRVMVPTNTPLTREAAKKLMALDLTDKEITTYEKLDEWYTAWGGSCYVSFSGGKDSTVLAYLAARYLSSFKTPPYREQRGGGICQRCPQEPKRLDNEAAARGSRAKRRSAVCLQLREMGISVARTVCNLREVLRHYEKVTVENLRTQNRAAGYNSDDGGRKQITAHRKAAALHGLPAHGLHVLRVRCSSRKGRKPV